MYKKPWSSVARLPCNGRCKTKTLLKSFGAVRVFSSRVFNTSTLKKKKKIKEEFFYFARIRLGILANKPKLALQLYLFLFKMFGCLFLHYYFYFFNCAVGLLVRIVSYSACTRYWWWEWYNKKLDTYAKDLNSP